MVDSHQDILDFIKENKTTKVFIFPIFSKLKRNKAYAREIAF